MSQNSPPAYSGNPDQAGGGLAARPSSPTSVATPSEAPSIANPKHVENMLQRSAFVSAFSISIPDKPDRPIPPPGGSNDPMAMIGIQVFEQPHRFDVTVFPPRGGRGFRAANIVGKEHAFLTLHWMLTPEDYYSLPNQYPPPTLLDMTQSQRFTMLDGLFVFDDEGKNRFHGFGAGRTFPTMVNGAPQLALGANGNIMQGFGIFEGVQGSYVINGYIAPPTGLYLQMVFRIIDVAGRFTAHSSLTPLDPIQDPDPTSTFLTLFGEPDPERPIEQQFSNGQLVGATVNEILRTASLNFDKGRRGDGLRTMKSAGPVIGRMRTVLSINPFSAPGTAESPVPWYTTSTQITFFDDRGSEVATLAANVVEGRAFKTDLPGVPLAYRLVGFGPLLNGTGEFSGVQGILSVNSLISLQPPGLSNVYVIRFADPKFRAVKGKAGR